MKKIIITIMMFVPMLAMADSELDSVRNGLKALNIKAQPDSITKSSLPGFYEVSFGAQVFYITADARYMIEGDIWDLQKRVNLTEQKRGSGRLKAMASLDEDHLLIFGPEKNKKKYSITVFTDIDCGYCRKLHNEMSQYNDLGIEIRYASYPHAGLQSESYFKAVAVWYAEDQQ